MAKNVKKLSELALKKPEAPEAASPAPAPQTQEPPAVLPKPERVKDYKAMTLRLNLDAWRALRYLAFDDGRPAHDLMVDALNDYFKKRGKPPLA